MTPELQLPIPTIEVRSDTRKNNSSEQLISNSKDIRRIAQATTNKSVYPILDLTPDVVATLGANGTRSTSAFSIDTNGKMTLWNSSQIGETTATFGIKAKENSIVPTIQLVRSIGTNFSIYANLSGPNFNNSTLGFSGRIDVNKDFTVGAFFEPGISGQGNYGRFVAGYNH
jgi:hypothetical protein